MHIQHKLNPHALSYGMVNPLLLLLHPPNLRRISQVLITQPHSHPLPPVNSLLNRLLIRNLPHIRIMLNLKLAAQVLRPNKHQNDDIRVHTAHEDTDDLAVVVPLRGPVGREREPFADGGLDGRARRADEVAELVRRADDEGPEGARRQLHEVDGDDAPGALHAELLEEGGGDDALVGYEAVRVEEGAADHADGDDAEPAAEGLREEPDDGAARHGPQVRDDLRDGYLVFVEAEFVLEHRRVQTGWSVCVSSCMALNDRGQSTG